MKLFNIQIYRKLPSKKDFPLGGYLYIELGKWWEIVITRRLAEHISGKGTHGNVFKESFFIKSVKEGEIIPFWYGYGYYDFDRDCGVYFPVPINFIVAIACWLRWKWYMFKGLSRKFNSTQEAYSRGYKDAQRKYGD